METSKNRIFTIFGAIFLVVILTLSPVNGQIVSFSQNTVSSESNIDGISNTGTSGTSFSETQVNDGSSQVLTENNVGNNTQNWSYYKPLYVNSTDIDSDLIDFPLYLEIIDSDLKTKAQTDGDDIAFFSEAGMKLNHEIQLFDQNYSPTHAYLSVWIQVDLYANTNTRLEMRYGNPDLPSQETIKSTWSSYNHIWHLDEDPSGVAPQINDSRGDVDGTSVGTMTSTDLIVSPLDQGIEFDNSNDYISLGTLDSDVWTGLTLSLWFNKTASGTDSLFGFSNSTTTSDNIFSIYADSVGSTDRDITVKIGTDGAIGSPATSVSTSLGIFEYNTWNHVAVTWSTTEETIKIYFNGQQVKSASKTGDSLINTGGTATAAIAAAYASPNNLFSGAIDEVRISQNSLSSAWLKAEYSNQKNPSQFIQISSEKVFDFVDPIDQQTNIDDTQMGSISNYYDIRENDSILAQFTEQSASPNSYGISSTGSSYMSLGTTVSWARVQGTISMWMYFNDFSVTHRPWGMSGNMELRTGTDGRLVVDFGDTSIISTIAMSTFQWYYIAIVWDSSIDKLELYISSPSNFNLNYNVLNTWTYPLEDEVIVQNDFMASRGGANPVNGRGDELRFYDRPLTSSELEYSHNRTLTGQEEGLQSYYPFDDQTYTDKARLGDDGAEFGTLTFTTSLPTFNTADFKFDFDAEFTNIPYQEAGIELAIKSGTMGAEDLRVDYWDGSSWVNLFTDLLSDAWTTTDITAQVTSSQLTLRFYDSDRTFDTSSDIWNIDAVLLMYKDYELDWEHEISGIDPNREYYDLAIRGSSSSASESYDVSLWDPVASLWTIPLTSITSTLDWYNLSITDTNTIASSMYLRYTDTNRLNDQSQDTLNLDYVAINSYDRDPVISPLPVDTTYNEGTTGHSITWSASDDNPNQYTIYVNGSLQTNQIWDGSDITYSIDGRVRGMYNLTIVIEDDYTGSTTDTVFFEVLDVISPTIDPTIDYTMVEQSTSNSLNWTANDLHPDSYIIYENGSSVQSSTWSNSEIINYSIDGLSKGYYNFTVVFVDDSGNSASNTIFVTVNDETPPEVTGDLTPVMAEESSNNYLSWTATDIYPDNYILYRDGVQINSSTWISGSAIRQNIDGFSVGEYNYTIIIFDSSGNMVKFESILTVQDVLVPDVVGPGTVAYNLGVTGNTITWTLSDTNPGTYTIYRDGSFLFNTNWLNGDLTIGIDGLQVGSYNYTIVVSDEYGNSASNSVIVTVSDIDAPQFDNEASNTTVSESSENNLLSWIATDASPDTYTIYENNSPVASSTWVSGGSISYNIDHLTKGLHNITIVVFDDSGNIRVSTAWVTVTDSTSPLTTKPANQSFEYSATGKTITWTATDSYPDTYTIELDGNFLSSNTWSSGVGITLTIDGYDPGSYNFTIIIFDDSGNFVIDTVIIQVNDSTNPQIDSPSDKNYFDQDSPKTVEWTATDDYAATYILYQNGLQLKTGSWTSGIQIQYQFDSLPIGSYNFTLFVVDETGNFISDEVIVDITDNLSPSIDTPTDIIYEEGSTGNSLDWTISDAYPLNQIVYRNGSIIQSGSWTSGIFQINIDGLPLGIYNYTIYLTDSSGNTSFDTVFVFVEDNQLPIFNSTPNNLTITEVSTGNQVNWVITDKNPDYYQFFVNGQAGTQTTWLSGNTISYGLDSLIKGKYNITILIADTSGNMRTSSIWINVIDSTSPSINSPIDNTIEYGSVGNEITWNPTDAYANTSVIYLDGVVYLGNSSWVSGNPIQINIDGLALGSYNFTIVVSDDSGNLSSDTVNIVVKDTTNPSLISDTADYQYNEESTSNTISWTASDLRNSSYIITRNGLQVASGSWNSGEAVSINTDGLLLGTYTYAIVFFDTSGNTLSNEVVITVVDNNSPVIVSPGNFSYFEGDTGNTINWDISDTHPSQMSIYRNGTLILSTNWSNTITNINVDGLRFGVYNYTIVLTDSSGNSASDTIFITVIDNTLPVVNSPADKIISEGTPGNTLSWIATDLHPATYTIYRNGTVVKTGNWISGANTTINLVNTPAALFNYTIVIMDQSGNIVTDTVNVIVTAAPVFAQIPSDLDYVVGNTGYNISWTPSDVDPDTYVIYQDGVQVETGNWSSDIAIQYNVDGLAIGEYNFTIVISDINNNLISDTVMVVVSDMPKWQLEQTNISDYSEGSTGNQLQYNATDMFPDKYSIYINGSFYSSGIWDNATFIEINIDGLSLGIYNFTIYVNDTSNNIITSWVIVEVIDTTPPVFDIEYTGDIVTEVSENNLVSWNVTDLHAANFTIYMWDGTTNSTFAFGEWTSGVPISFNIDHLLKGNYTFYIEIQDSSNNRITSSALVQVIDRTNPAEEIADRILPATEITEVSTGNEFSLNITDAYASTYEVWINGSQVDGNVWTSGQFVTYNVDDLTKGYYNITFLFVDQSNNTLQIQFGLTVIDNTIPVENVTDRITPGTEINEVSIGNEFSLNVTDVYASTYEVWINGSLDTSDVWTSGQFVTYNVDDLTKGYYNITFLFIDESGNGLQIQFPLTVIDSTNPVENVTDRVTPGTEITEISTGNEYSLNVTDAYASTYEIWVNGSQIGGNVWNSGQFVTYNVDDLTKGYYNITFLFIDESGNSLQLQFGLTVIDNTIPVENVTDRVTPSTEITEVSTGNEYSLNVTDAYASTYEVWINGSQVDGGIWISGQFVTYNVDHLDKAYYNITFLYIDQSGNSLQIQFGLKVIDSTIPVQNELDQITPGIEINDLTTGNEYSLNVTDAYASIYEVWINGSLDTSDIWVSGQFVTYNVDHLDKAYYNITFLFIDESGNSLQIQFVLTIIDSTSPVEEIADRVTPGIEITEVSTNNQYTLNVTDKYASTYEVWINGSLDTSDVWTSGQFVTYNVDSLVKAYYNITFMFIDESGNSLQIQFNLTVIDNSVPTQGVSTTPGVEINDLDAGNTYSITANDAYASSYEIWLNGSLVEAGQWQSGSAILYNVDYLNVSYYNITFLFIDQSGNSLQVQYGLQVLDATNPVEISVSTPGTEITEISSGNEYSFNITDKYASTYEVYLNSSLDFSDAWISGQFVTYNVDLLSEGYYNITFLFLDESGNVKSYIYFLNVIDITSPSQGTTTTPGSIITEVSTDNEYSIVATDAHAFEYEVWINNSRVDFGTWNSGIAINYNVDTLTKGYYNITFMFIDQSGNILQIQFGLTVEDATAPVPIGTSITASEITDTSTGNWVNATATDDYADRVEIYVNGILNITASGSWSSNIATSFNIDHLGVGSYNITFIFIDESGNIVTIEELISVIDIADPSISDLGDIPNYLEGSSNNVLNWNANDNNPGRYLIYRNSTLLVNSTWTGDISLNIDGLLKGYYIYNITVFDTSGNFNSDLVGVTVLDQINPVVDQPDDLTFSEGSNGNTLVWVATDNHAYNYSIVINGSEVFTDTWNSGEGISYNLDALSRGNYEVTITVEDESGNIVVDTVWVIVEDTTAPVVSNESTATYEEGTTGNTITWTATDNYNSTYNVTVGGQIIASGNWNSGVPIVVLIDGYKIGDYAITITVYDESGNSQSSTTIFEVYETTPPVILTEQYYNVTYIEDEIVSLNWTVIDPYPGSYQLYRDFVFIKNGIWINNTQLQLNFTDLMRGQYNYTILFRDSSLNSIQSTVIVTILDVIDPMVTGDLTYTVRRGTTGNVLQWYATDSYPGLYSIYQNGSLIIGNSIWFSGSPISRTIGDLALGTYIYTIYVFDSSGNSVSFNTTVFVVDGEPPVLNTPASNSTFAESEIPPTLFWIYDDPSPDTFTILSNGTSIRSGIWQDGKQISFTPNSFDKGYYNITIIVYDEAGNFATHTIFLDVTDITPPQLLKQPQESVEYIEQTTGNTLIWAMNDDYDGSYFLYRNGSLIASDDWLSNVDVIVSIDGLSFGYYNYTFLIVDPSGNVLIDKVSVYVYDETLPEISNLPAPMEYIETEVGYTLEWVATDLHPSSYILTMNGEIFANDTWNETTDLVFDIDGLSYGEYTFILTVIDLSFNNASSTFVVQVQDIFIPIIEQSPDDLTTVILDTTGNTISWKVSDLNPDYYVVYFEGQPLQSRVWSSNTAIIVNVDGLNVGYYNYTIIVYDEAGNQIRDQLVLRIKDPNVTDTLRPTYQLESRVYEGDIEYINGTWIDINNQPVAGATISITLKLQQVVFSFETQTDNLGRYQLVFNYTDLRPGIYIWEVSFEKDMYQSWENIRTTVTVLPHNLGIQLNSPEQLIQGDFYVLWAIVYYNNDNSSDPFGLGLSQYDMRRGRVPGVAVVFTINVLTDDGPSTFIRDNSTDSSGVVIVSLNPFETANIISVESISVSLEASDQYNGASGNYRSDQLPEILPGEPGPLVRIQLFIQNNIAILVIIGLVVFMLILVLIYLRRKEMERIHALNNSIKQAFDEIRALESMKAIIIQTKSKLNIYEELLNDDGMNTNLVSGMISAFSTFLNELGRNEGDNTYGFETMQRGDVSVTVHRGENSNVIVISEINLPFVILGQITAIQKLVEKEFRGELRNSARGVVKLKQDQVHPILREAGFKIDLLNRMKLDSSNIRVLLRERTVSRAIKKHVAELAELPKSRYSQNETFLLSDVIDFFSSKGVNRRLSSRILIGAYELNVIQKVEASDIEVQ